MLPSATAEELLGAPAGRYLSGRAWLFFCAPSGLFGTLIAHCPDERDVERLTGVYTVYARARAKAPPHPVLFDASRLEFADAASFALLGRYFRTGAAPPARLFDKLAIVHGGGFAGAVVAGFRDVIRLLPAVRVFAVRAEALEWLGHPQALGTLGELDAILDGVDPWLRGLRALLRRSLADTDDTRIARELGLSRRSLQRRLQEAGTSFLRELQHLQLEVATQLLASTDEKVTAIALEVGCATPQRFSQLFRRHMGETPSEFRRRRRGV